MIVLCCAQEIPATTVHLSEAYPVILRLWKVWSYSTVWCAVDVLYTYYLFVSNATIIWIINSGTHLYIVIPIGFFHLGCFLPGYMILCYKGRCISSQRQQPTNTGEIHLPFCRISFLFPFISPVAIICFWWKLHSLIPGVNLNHSACTHVTTLLVAYIFLLCMIIL